MTEDRGLRTEDGGRGGESKFVAVDYGKYPTPGMGPFSISGGWGNCFLGGEVDFR